MGRKSRIKRERRKERVAPPLPMWEDADGIHLPMRVPRDLPPESAAGLSEEFQKSIRSSPIWTRMVEEFGEEEAARLLAECKVEVK